MIYPFKTTPYAHQLAAFERSKDAPEFALFHEQRCGKSKVVIDTACYLFGRGKVDAVLVLAPNGVHNGWDTDQWPTHAWDSVRTVTAAWASNQTQSIKARLDALFDVYEYPVLRVLHVNIEALSTKGKARDTVRRFLDCFTVMSVVDESTDIKNPGSKRTKAAWYIGERSAYTRILNGTPATRSPLDVYSQFRFMSSDLLGFQSYYAFRNRYAVMRRRNLPGRPAFDEVTGYQNMDELTDNIAVHSHRVVKSDCFDLPPRSHHRRAVPLSKRQRDLYNRLRKEALINLSGDDVAVPHVLTQMMRLQQILGGFVPTDTGEKAVPIEQSSPRLEALMADIAQQDSKTLVWCRFTAEIDAITKALKAEYGAQSTLRYDGSIKAVDRPGTQEAFQTDPGVRFLVLQEKAGARGLELSAAGYSYRYSASFDLDTYLQSEERPHSAAQTKNVAHVFLCAENTIDEKIVKSLEDKKQIADMITRDNPKSIFE